MNDTWFPETRYGLFIRYGLYSLLDRGKWVWNREAIPREEDKALAGQFGGLQNKVLSVCLLDSGEALPFTQTGTRVQTGNVPTTDEAGLWPALKTERYFVPAVYQAGSLRIPKVPHPHYGSLPA